MRFHDCPTTGINNLHTIPINKHKLCQNYMTLENFPKERLQKHISNWRLIIQHKQTQINDNNVCKNTSRIYQDYQVGDKVMLLKIQHTNEKPHIRGHTK